MARLLPLLLLLLVAACAAPERVVLLDNADGHRSELVVTSGGGSAAVDRAGAGLAVASRDAAPQPIAPDAAEIDRTWGAALASHPPAPVTFRLYFILDTTQLTPESRQTLPQVLDLIRSRPAPEVVVIGHTDRSGDPAYNYELGLRRARIVEREALALGVPPALVHVGSHGAADPLVAGSETYNPRNRRVEITVR